MSNTVLLLVIILGFVILLLLNIFLVYIPINKIEKALTDIDTKVEEGFVALRPVINKVLPLLETL